MPHVDETPPGPDEWMDDLEIAAHARDHAGFVVEPAHLPVTARARWCDIRGWCLTITDATADTCHVRIDDPTPAIELINAAVELAIMGQAPSAEPEWLPLIRVG